MSLNHRSRVLVHSQRSTSLISEGSPFLSNTSFTARHDECCPLTKYLCLSSKAVSLILMWTAVIGIIYYTVIGTFLLQVSVNSITHQKSVSTLTSLPFAILALVMIFYPLSGFIADVCCGRYRAIMTTLIIITISIFIFSIGFLLYILLIKLDLSHQQYTAMRWLHFCLYIMAGAMFIVGLVGYQANFIQFGLDQLLEMPSEYLGLFVHWAKWINNATAIVTIAGYMVFACNIFDHSGGLKKDYRIIDYSLLSGIHVLCFFVMIILLMLSFRKSHWFYSEPGQHNPYKIVLKILNYIRTHKYPRQRSAFTYGDSIIPSRFDFAKERFGGPFTTKQVEDVKSFLRILLILLVLGPIHVLQVPGSFIVFPLFGLHTGYYNDNIISNSDMQADHEQCNWKVLFLRSNSMVWLLSSLVFPLYIWFIFSFLRNRMPKILIRLSVGILLLFLGVVNMLIVDAVGHSVHLNTDSPNTTVSHDLCMFRARSHNGYLHYPTLNLHWSVLIPPNILLGIGPLLIETTTLEFISAQSPHSMKGFLVGIFFAIKGLFQFLGSITIIPVSLKHPLGIHSFNLVPSFISCGFIYLLFTCVVGLVGMILFFVAARKYKNRERDEVTFRQGDVEEIYDRYLTQVATASTSYDHSGED